jgi:hypothetical protein
MAIKLTVWDGTEQRVYINARYADRRHASADGSYFKADPSGKVYVSFKSSWSGEFGEATFAVMEYFGITREMEFTKLVECVKNAKGPRGGSFNEDAFINLMTSRAVA